MRDFKPTHYPLNQFGGPFILDEVTTWGPPTTSERKQPCSTGSSKQS